MRAYAETYGLEFPIGFDASSAVFGAYQGYGLPTHLFIDRDGTIQNVWRGPLTTAEAERLLAPSAGGRSGADERVALAGILAGASASP